MRIDIAGFARGAPDMPHERLMQVCERADALGYGGIWFNEFHFQPTPQAYPSTLLLASAALARTKALRVGTSIVVLPLYHPLMLAEMVAQLHWQSGGRFDLGIGRGTHPDTLRCLGIAPEDTRRLFESAYDVLTSALYSVATIEADSPWPASDTPVGPLLAGQNVPIYVGGSTEETIGFAAKHALPLLLSLEPPETAQCAVYSQTIKRDSLVDRSAEFSLSRFAFVARSKSAAETLMTERYDLFYRRRIDAAQRAGRDITRIGPPDLDRFRDTQAIVGTPDECAEQIAALGAKHGISSIRLVFNGNGALDDEIAINEMSLLGKDTLPHFR